MSADSRSFSRNWSRLNLSLAPIVALIAILCASIFIFAKTYAAQGKRRHSVTPSPRPPDWDKLTQEATDLLSNYIRINTTDPPGDELPAAKMLREKFLADGIPATIWESSPGRAILAARLRGVGRHTKSIILLSHMDVVPANPKEWQVPPFSGTVKNGEIWGRGALDDKGPAVVELMAMLAIKRMGVLLDRDILFLATAGEEVGGAAGAGWVLEHKPDLYSDAGYLLNEGGGILVQKSGKLYTVSVSEKTPLWLRLTATGPAGHAAVPPAETAVTRLIAALDRLDTFRTPIRVINPVRDYFHSLAMLGDAPDQFSDLAVALRKDPAFARNFVAVPGQNAQVRDTITPTVLHGSDKTNAIPSSAYAEVDCRLLPGTDKKEFLATIHKVIADKSIKVDVLLNFPPASSPQKSLLMNAIRIVAQRFDKAPAVPRLLDGFTDSHYFREKGIVAYGFIPLEVTPAEMHEVHGINERIAVKNLKGGIQRMVDLLEIIGGREGQ